MVTNVLAMMNHVQEQGELGRARGMENKFRSLTAAAMNGDQNAYGQQVQIDPERAKQVQAAGDLTAKKVRGAAKYMKEALDRNNPLEIEGRYRAVRPMLLQAGQAQGKVPPATWTPDMLPMIEETLAKTAYLDMSGKEDQVQSTRIGADGFYYTVDRMGQWTNSGIKADPRTQLRDAPGVTPGIVDLRTGSTTPLQGGGAPAAQAAPAAPAAPTAQFTGPDGMPIQIEAGLPPQVMASIQADAARWNGAPSGSSAQIGPPPAQGGNQLATSSVIAARPLTSPAEEERLRLAREAAQRQEEAVALRARGTAPAGYRFNEAGGLEPIPGAPAAAGATPTEGERGAAGYLQRMKAAETEVSQLAAQGYRPNARDAYTAGEGPLLNWAATDTGQVNRQQQEDWVRAKLRKESGAAIPEAEMDREIKTYFPQIGDSEAVLQSKARSRQTALKQMEIIAGRAEGGSNAPGRAAPAAVPVQRARNPQTGEVVEFRNGQWVPAR